MNSLRQVSLGVGSLAAVALVPSQALAQQTTAAISSAVALPTFAPQRVTPGRDRFLDEPVLTTDALVDALKTNKVFRRNLSRHFQIPEERVVSFVQDALVPYILPMDRKVTNFGVTKSGVIYGKPITLRKGTRVWATRNGSPILKWICSNPLVYRAPVLKDKPKPSTVSKKVVPSGVTQVATSVPLPPSLEGVPTSTLGIQVPPEPPKPPIHIAQNPIPTPTPAPTPTPVRPTPAPRSRPRIARTGLPLLPIAGVVGAVVRSVPAPKVEETEQERQEPTSAEAGTSVSPQAGSGAAITRSTRASVPEPGALALLAFGALGLPLLRRRK